MSSNHVQTEHDVGGSLHEDVLPVSSIVSPVSRESSIKLQGIRRQDVQEFINQTKGTRHFK
jgi:translation initiation factor 1 (eIF-1/SUI1)